MASVHYCFWSIHYFCRRVTQLEEYADLRPPGALLITPCQIPHLSPLYSLLKQIKFLGRVIPLPLYNKKLILNISKSQFYCSVILTKSSTHKFTAARRPFPLDQMNCALNA